MRSTFDELICAHFELLLYLLFHLFSGFGDPLADDRVPDKFVPFHNFLDDFLEARLLGVSSRSSFRRDSLLMCAPVSQRRPARPSPFQTRRDLFIIEGLYEVTVGSSITSDAANPLKRQRVSNDAVPSSTEPES